MAAPRSYGRLCELLSTIAAAGMLCAPAQAEMSRQAAAVASRPNCQVVQFSGIAVGGDPINLQAVRDADDPEDLVARNPLRCSPNALTQTYTCYGAAFVQNHPGFIVNWSAAFYQVITPLDLIGGRRDTMVFIDRSAAVCANETPPALNIGDNVMAFFRTKHPYR